MAAKHIKKYATYTCAFNNQVTQTGQLIVERSKSIGEWFPLKSTRFFLPPEKLETRLIFILALAICV